MNCPYEAYFASLVQQATLTERLNSSFDQEITRTKEDVLAQQRRSSGTTHDRRRDRSVLTGKSDKEDGDEKISRVVMLLVADPASSRSLKNRRCFHEQNQEPGEPESHHHQLAQHPRWGGAVASPSKKCSSSTHHHQQTGPPSPPIRKASYDTWLFLRPDEQDRSRQLVTPRSRSPPHGDHQEGRRF